MSAATVASWTAFDQVDINGEELLAEDAIRNAVALIGEARARLHRVGRVDVAQMTSHDIGIKLTEAADRLASDRRERKGIN